MTPVNPQSVTNRSSGQPPLKISGHAMAMNANSPSSLGLFSSNNNNNSKVPEKRTREESDVRNNQGVEKKQKPNKK